MSKETKNKPLQEDAKEELDVKAEIISWIKTIVVALVAVLIITQVIIINVKVPSGSMENTIMTNDRVMGARFSYWFNDPQRGDIVVFRYPVDRSTKYIKRVIGLPGETVEIRDGHVYIDGSDTPLQEDYLKEEWLVMNDGLTYEVPEGCYFMMGDNRNNSQDSRYWADIALQQGVAQTVEDASTYTYVPKKDILGKAIFRYYKGFKNLTNTANYN